MTRKRGRRRCSGVSEEEQGIVQSFFLLGVIVAPPLGRHWGGWINDKANALVVFFINLPIG